MSSFNHGLAREAENGGTKLQLCGAPPRQAPVTVWQTPVRHISDLPVCERVSGSGMQHAKRCPVLLIQKLTGGRAVPNRPIPDLCPVHGTFSASVGAAEHLPTSADCRRASMCSSDCLPGSACLLEQTNRSHVRADGPQI